MIVQKITGKGDVIDDDSNK